MLDKDRYANQRHMSIMENREKRKYSINKKLTRLQIRKSSLAAEIKQDKQKSELKMRKKEYLIAQLKKMNAEKLRESTQRTNESKYKLMKVKFRRINKEYSQIQADEEKKLLNEQKRFEKLILVENSLLQKVRNTQVSQELALGKLYNALIMKPSNYENYKKLKEEYESKMRNSQKLRKQQNKTVTVTRRSMNESNNNSGCAV